ncbi:MAG: hypothetical protein HZA64_14840 [Rhodocyclales bacterium]|nr:hypothetical protein [Rhodocyclales bacterium]
MHLTLLVPGLLWPREILRDTTFDLPLPALSRLLGRGRRTPLAGEETWLADTFGVAAPLPAAALRLLADGGKPGGDEWICLDPVHLRLHEWAVIPDAPATLALTVEEDAALRDSVAPLFAGLGELVASAPGRWHLHLIRPAAIETRPLSDAIGRAVEPTLPGGPQGAEWRRLLAEVQPLLHAHEVNRERIKAGRTTVNHLWPWGGGRLPQNAQRPFDRVWTDDPVLQGLAVLAGSEVAPPPADFTEAPGRVLVKLDQLVASSTSFDALTWRAALAKLEADWLAPALRGGASPRLTFVASGHDRALAVTLSTTDRWRFWKKPLKLAELDA